MKLEKKINDEFEESEDATKYGEFVTSYFAWIPLDLQKRKVEKMEKITKKQINIKKHF